jgi:hypothetical protein
MLTFTYEDLSYPDLVLTLHRLDKIPGFFDSIEELRVYEIDPAGFAECDTDLVAFDRVVKKIAALKRLKLVGPNSDTWNFHTDKTADCEFRFLGGLSIKELSIVEFDLEGTMDNLTDSLSAIHGLEKLSIAAGGKDPFDPNAYDVGAFERLLIKCRSLGVFLELNGANGIDKQHLRLYHRIMVLPNPAALTTMNLENSCMDIDSLPNLVKILNTADNLENLNMDGLCGIHFRGERRINILSSTKEGAALFTALARPRPYGRPLRVNTGGCEITHRDWLFLIALVCKNYKTCGFMPLCVTDSQWAGNFLENRYVEFFFEKFPMHVERMKAIAIQTRQAAEEGLVCNDLLRSIGQTIWDSDMNAHLLSFPHNKNDPPSVANFAQWRARMEDDMMLQLGIENDDNVTDAEQDEDDEEDEAEVEEVEMTEEEHVLKHMRLDDVDFTNFPW